MKDTIAVMAIVVVAVVFDAVMDNAGVPVTFLDVLIVAVSLLILYLPVNAFFTKHNPTKKAATPVRLKPEWSKLILGLVLLIMLSASALYLGLDDPWKLYKGIKGPAHGYTIVLLGIALAVIGVMLGYSLLLLVKQKLNNARSDK